jgi:phosphatidate cytidylyltransferase
MVKRIISGIVLMFIAIFATLYSYTSFSVLMVAMLCFALYEVMQLLAKKQLYKTVAVSYIIMGTMALIFLRQIDIRFVIFVFAVVWSCDIFAYFIGTTFGKHKMLEKVSPKKTWEGTIGGVIIASIVGFCILQHMGFSNVVSIVISLECAILTVLGDLLESATKRLCNVKDTGKIIPGHGGILDRIDGLIPVSLLVFLWLLVIVLVHNKI